jgi:hypothetical protein
MSRTDTAARVIRASPDPVFASEDLADQDLAAIYELDGGP